MKKSFLIPALLLLISSCGPSAEEKAAFEKRLADSISNAAAQRVRDSIDNALRLEAEAQSAKQAELNKQAELDSLKSELEKAKKKPATSPKPKKSPEQKQEEKDKKELENAVRGRG